MQVQGKLKNLFKKISLLLPFLLCFLLALKEFKLFSWQQTQRIYYPLIGIIILWAFIVIVFLAFKFARIKWGKERKWLLLLFLLVFPFMTMGPFLSPPSDPVFHANLLWDSLDQNIFAQPNREFIAKTIFSLFFFISPNHSYISNFLLIFIFHCFNILLFSFSTYLASRVCGINSKWSILSVFLMILFFGTNRFSYFSYYSLAPSMINFSFIWILEALFVKVIIRKTIDLNSVRELLYLILISILILPILLYNHYQEIIFFLFFLSLYFFILLHRLASRIRKLSILFSFLSFLVLFFPFAILMEKKIEIPYSRMSWIEIQLYLKNVSSTYNTPWLFFEWNNSRIWDTLGLLGLFPNFIILIKVLFNLVQEKSSRMNHIYMYVLLGSLPFWVYLVPFNMMIWLNAQVYYGEYFWRMAYATQFWIILSHFFYQLEKPFNALIRKLSLQYDQFS